MSKELIGHVAVDAGMLMVGDPCYFHGGREKSQLDQAYPAWRDVCAALHKAEAEQGGKRGTVQLNFVRGHEGLGVIASTTHGDGFYPVYLEKDKNGKRRMIVHLD